MHPLTRSFLINLTRLVDLLRAAAPAVAQSGATSFANYLARVERLEQLRDLFRVKFTSDELPEHVLQLMSRASGATEALGISVMTNVGQPDGINRIAGVFANVLGRVEELAIGELNDRPDSGSAGLTDYSHPPPVVPPAEARPPPRPVAASPMRSAERSTAARPIVEQQGQPDPPLPRYANVVLLEALKDTRLSSGSPLAPGLLFRLRLDIGALSAQSQVTNETPLPEEKLPKNITLSW